MKIIALMPVKNEEWILNTTIPQLKKFVDEILVLDVESNDTTTQILEQNGVMVKKQQYHPVNYSAWRQRLLDWGRKRGGTHFVFLDADEAFTSNFLSSFKKTLKMLQPGQTLILDWLSVWDSPNTIRSDDSIWSKLSKDFVFCDDKKSNFLSTKLHEGRTPCENTFKNAIELPRSEGAILHYQFVSQKQFQIKQVFMACRELTSKNAMPLEINKRYSITLDTNNVTLSPIHYSWIEGIENTKTLSIATGNWYKEGILKFFKEYGVRFFEPLNIWHITELHEIFVKKIGRNPKPTLQTPVQTRIKMQISKCIPRVIKEKIKEIIQG